eukprot:gnl/MRDRNA2_/MRDRNA2_146784_c0_seq1.p1 gnl/MRDRNA2_/MRDRNA2_146784_c0~~gnl/MRDRNA2_/MRDRNA2_146784_c0_seq1.p1  ORF type:complete len:222 (-),score=42.86 gnl/MRDRNA2_/MRDRNA2_146784_c0_seq1:312-899(-)
MAGTAHPADRKFLTWTDGSITIVASKCPTTVSNAAQAIDHDPDKNTLIFSGTHGDEDYGDAYVSHMIFGDSFSSREIAEGNCFYMEDMANFVHHFAEAAEGTRDDNGKPRSFSDTREKPNGIKGYLRRTQDFDKPKNRRGAPEPTPDQKLDTIANDIVNFVREKDIQKIVVAYCFSAQNPLIPKVAAKLGIQMTV